MGLLYRKGSRAAAGQKIEKELTVVNRLGLHDIDKQLTLLSCFFKVAHSGGILAQDVQASAILAM